MKPTVANLEREALKAALDVCVDRLTHGPLPGNENWWALVTDARRASDSATAFAPHQRDASS